jgi:hypothetical protein
VIVRDVPNAKRGELVTGGLDGRWEDDKSLIG